MRPKLPANILAALLAGTIAIVLNMFVLDALKNAGVETRRRIAEADASQAVGNISINRNR